MQDILNYIISNQTLQIVLIAITFYIIIQMFIKVFAFYWKVGYEKRSNKRENKRKQKLKWKYSKVNNSNSLINNILSKRFIIFMGSLGQGKSILMNLFSHIIIKRREQNNKKQKRYNKIMNYNYFLKEEELKNSNLLALYSNLKFRDRESGYLSQELMPYLTLNKKAVQKCVFAIDEVSSLFPKDIYYDREFQNSTLSNDMKELFKKGRHYLDCYFLGTEQDGADIYIGFRKNGYALITCLGTIVTISRFGKCVRFFKNLYNLLMPGIITINYARVFRQQLFLSDKIKTVFKMLLPSYLLLPKEYYTRKIIINNQIKERYQRYQTKLEFENAEYYLRFTNEDIYSYDTRAFKFEYDRIFTKDGERIKIDKGK